MASGYTTRLPFDTILDAGVLYVNGLAAAATTSPSRGGLTFDPGEEITNVEYDGKKGAVAGLDRKTYINSSISGNLIKLGLDELRDFQTGADRSAPLSILPAGELFEKGRYLQNVTLRYRRAGGGFVDVVFPLARVSYSLSGQDRSEGEAAVTIVAVQDPADLGMHGGKPPFRIDVSIEINELISALGTDLVAIYDGRFGVTLSSGVVSRWDDARGSVGFAPPMVQASAARRPAYSAEAGELVYDGVDDAIETVLDPRFAVSAAAPLWGAAIGWSDPAAGSIRYFFALHGGTGAFRVATGVRQGTYIPFYDIGGTQLIPVSGAVPAVSGTHRLAIISIAPNAPRRLRVLDHGEEQLSATPDDTIAEGAVQAGGIFSTGSPEGAIRAVIVGKGTFPDATQLSALRSYAILRGASMI